MGVKVQDAQRGFIYCEADRLKGCDIQLDYPSVGATENIMLASVFAEGETLIRNAAREPEILDLQNYLQATGIQVTGAGNTMIRICGGEHRLRNAEHTIITDRIVTGTYMTAAGITGGELLLRNVIPEHMSSITAILRESGCRISIKGSTMLIIGPSRLRAVDIIRTLPYPGFPTDMQAQLVAMLTMARGTSIMVETV
jgi:UDP-N-acetylglucosamine 1-carboxyvinyltransferase